MAHYAFLDSDNAVTGVIVGRDETDLTDGVESWEIYYGDFKGQLCLQTSYNTYGGVHYTDGEPSTDQSKALRYNYAGIGFTYEEARNAFIPPKPFESWILDEGICLWQPPLPYPEDGGNYRWDEDLFSWELDQ